MQEIRVFAALRALSRAVRVTLGAAAGSLALCGVASASPSGVVISQVYGGNGNVYASDYVELFNAGVAPVSLAGWSVQYASATGSGTFASNGAVAVNGTLQPGQYHLVRLATTTGAALPFTPDSTGSINLSGTNGKVALVRSTTGLACNGSTAQPCSAGDLALIEDLVGYGSANFFEGAPAPAATATLAILRGAAGCNDSGSNAADFATGTPTPRYTGSPTATCGAPASIVPLCPSALTVASGAAVSFALRASDSDSIVNAVTFAGGQAPGMSLTGFVAPPAAGGTAEASLALDGSTADGSYSVTVQFSNNDGQTGLCLVSVQVAPVSPTFTPIYTIQGSGATSTLTGTRTTRGVVTKLNNNGYYLQDAAGDGDPATSDGIFVFTGGAPTVSPGHEVQITGTVTEFNTGAATNAATLAAPITEFTNLTSLVFTGTGSVVPTVLTLPLPVGQDFERYEGMLVQITTPLAASQNFFLGRYGQVTVSAGGRMFKPTQLHRPLTTAALDLADLNRRSSLLLDDGTSQQNPDPTPYFAPDNTLRAGDTLTSLTGVIDYGLATNDNEGLAMYRLHPSVAPAFTRANARPASPPALTGNVKVASFNVLNYFTTFGDGTTASGGTGAGCAPSNTTADCRGADSLAEFLRQRSKIVEALFAINADVFGLMEIQNNGNAAAQNLVDALNTRAGATTWAVVPLPPTTGTDAIRVAMIYKPGRLGLVGGALSDAAAIHNRPPLAQGFSLGNGEAFSVVVNHFKSKSGCDTATGPDTDQGDGQGCWNNRRTLQSQALLSFIETVKTSVGDPDVLVIGDLNAYAQEDPVHTLVTGGLVDEAARALGLASYSFTFDGEAGSLDHALASAGLSARVTGAAHWHINTDEPSHLDYNLEFRKPACATCAPDYYTATPYRSSDHDPLIVAFDLQPPAAAQTITFAPLADLPLGTPSFNVSATATSGLAVVFSGSTPATCTVGSTGQVTLLAVGTCTVLANQPGNGAWLPAPQVARSFVVTTGAGSTPQWIQFEPIASKPVDFGTFTLVAAATSGLSVTFSSLSPTVCTLAGLEVQLLSVGTCVIAADQAGNGIFAAAAQNLRSFEVTAAGTLEGEVPTLPQWGLMALGALLAAQMLRRGAR